MSFSVLVNDSPTCFFKSQRSLRQGDPLSDFLFILAMKGLNNMIKTTNVNGWLRGFEVARAGGEPGTSSMQMTLTFCDAEEENLKILKTDFGTL